MDLKKLRKEKGWSQGDLSTFSGLSVKTIHRIDPGEATDLAQQMPALLEEMLADYEAYVQTNNVMLMPDGNGSEQAFRGARRQL